LDHSPCRTFTTFEFGENWREYAKTIDDRRIADAIARLEQLFPNGPGVSAFSISGLVRVSSLAALSIGAEPVLALDIDENSVATTRQLLSARASSKSWNARLVSVFDTSLREIPSTLGEFCTTLATCGERSRQWFRHYIDLNEARSRQEYDVLVSRPYCCERNEPFP
jgi:hypothetical protein